MRINHRPTTESSGGNPLQLIFGWMIAISTLQMLHVYTRQFTEHVQLPWIAHPCIGIAIMCIAAQSQRFMHAMSARVAIALILGSMITYIVLFGVVALYLATAPASTLTLLYTMYIEPPSLVHSE